MDTSNLPTHHCELPECGKEFFRSRSDKRYCCTAHKDKHLLQKARAKRTGVNGVDASAQQQMFEEPIQEEQTTHTMEVDDDDEPIKAPPSLSSPARMVATPSLGPLGSFMLQQKGNETEFYKKAYEEERAKRKKIKEKYQAVTTELAELKTNNRIAEIEGNAKPKGLAGMFSGINVMEVLNHPLAQQVAMGIVSKFGGSAAPQMGGVDQGTIPLINWINSMSEEAKQAFAILVSEISKTEDQEKLTDLLTRLTNVVTGNTMSAASPGAANGTNAQATGSYAY